MQKLLLLHGALGSTKQLFPLYEHLKDDFEPYLINFSGHGGEPLPDEKFSIEMFCGDVINWMDKTGTESIDIFGYSMGGYTALTLAKLFPFRINKIFTFAAKLKWTNEASEKESAMLNVQKLEEKLPEFVEMLKNRHHPSDWKMLMTKTSEMVSSMSKNAALHDEDFSKIKHKVLLGVGDKDSMVTIEETLHAFKLLPNGNMLVLPNTYHPFERIDLQKLSFEIKKFFLDNA